MAKPSSQRERWKRMERSVAQYFNTTRNVHGRGPAGETGTDVVADLPNWLDEPPSLFSDYRFLFVECKYSNGTDGAIFNHFRELREASSMTKKQNSTKVYVCNYGDYLITSLDSVPFVMGDILLPKIGIDGLQFHKDPLSILTQYGTVHSSKKTPGYLDKYWDQVTRDVDIFNEDRKHEKAIPMVCMGSSFKEKLALFNISWFENPNGGKK